MLKEERKKRGLTQEALAKLSNLNKDTISRIERGKEPGSIALLKLSEALKIDTKKLYKKTRA